MPDIPGNTSTTSVITGTGAFTSALETSGDSDWWRVTLVAGRTYDFTFSGDGSATSLDDANFYILDSLGATLDSGYTYSGGPVVLSLTAATSGTYYIAVSDGRSDGQPEGNYVIRARMNDLLPNDNSTTGVVVNGMTSGALETSGDADRYKVMLTAGQRVDFTLSGDGSATSLDDANFQLLDQYGNVVASNYTYSGGPIWVAATASYTGAYYLVVADGSSDSGAEGSFRIDARLTDRVLADTSTTSSLRDGTSIAGQIDARGDADWTRFNAVAGTTYTFTLSGDGSANALGSKELVLRDASGNAIKYDYTYGTGSVTIEWKATSSAPVYLDSHSNSSTSGWGGYTLSVVSDAPVLTGTAGHDRLTAGSNDNRVIGLAGNDTLDGGAGNDTLVGGQGNDSLIGGAGIDTADYTGSLPARVYLGITGPQNTWQGADVLSGIENLLGGSGNDRFFGSTVGNVLNGGAGNDQLYGGGGNDTLIGGAGNDFFHGGADADVILFEGSAAVDVDIVRTTATGQGTDTLGGVENITGGSGSDIIRGNAAANVLNGAVGNDTLVGRGGSDVLTGGSGSDRFVFANWDGNDRVTDFQNGLDRIEIGGPTTGFRDLSVYNSAEGAVISWGGGTTITLAGIDRSMVDASDFIFT
ncbi:calcium-binding protein [Paracoccus sanguinis]|uniref:calcium-binding protein n=1 Tax=Paracoccus sanguinis TaxID=1545044 RepID=UPI0014525D10|nr:calcium-binding protein [Paracoccus sanguinis]QJD16166.1 calcium-binding protein [Paracoccus sanguinis]